MVKLALQNVHIITGRMPNEVLRNQTIFINDLGIIEKIDTSQATIPPEYKLKCYEGQYVMPGLINAHVHLFADGKPFSLNDSMLTKENIDFIQSKAGKKELMCRMKENVMTALGSGVTSMRSVGEFFYLDVSLRDKFKQEEAGAPNLLASGYFISAKGGHGAPFLALETTGANQARANACEILSHSVDQVKICATGGVTDAKSIGEAGKLQMTVEEVQAICEEAHRQGKKVAAHAEGKEGVRVALLGGVDTIEHGSEMDQEMIDLFKNNPRALKGYTALIPTFAAAYPNVLLAREVSNITEIVYENSKHVYQAMITGLKQAMQNGIKVGLGTDAGMPYVTQYNTWRELVHMRDFAEIDPAQIIQFVTKNNAEILDISNVTGTIEVGKYADLLVLAANPIEQLETLRAPASVFAKGKEVASSLVNYLPEIDEKLEQIQK